MAQSHLHIRQSDEIRRNVETVEAGWQQRAACRGGASALFYPPTTTESRNDRADREMAAKAICSQCPVRHSCLDYAVAIREPHGIWGGLNELERRMHVERQANSVRR